MIDALTITSIGGNCPVQAEGLIGGKPFYFRARHEHWSFGVGAEPIGDPDWYLSERWTNEPSAAGWMEESEALKIIDKCARFYLSYVAKAS